MITTLHDAKSKLEADGLHVSWNNPHSLWIAANLVKADEEIRISPDACALIENGSRWVAVFPAEGLFTFEVPGNLAELVDLISSVYKEYRRAGGTLKDAFEGIIGNPKEFLTGHSLSPV